MIYTFQVKVHPVTGPVAIAPRLIANTLRIVLTKANASLQHLVLLGQRRELHSSRRSSP